MNSETYLKTWKTYQSAWGPVPASERRSLLALSVIEDIVYKDFSSQTHGVEELLKRIAQSQERFAGAYFNNDSFLEHHDQGLFRWTMFDKDGNVVVTGTSIGHFGEDGRLTHATGFFEAPSTG